MRREVVEVEREVAPGFVSHTVGYLMGSGPDFVTIAQTVGATSGVLFHQIPRRDILAIRSLK